MEKIVENGKFSDIKVSVPNYEEYKKEAAEIKDEILNASSAEIAVAAIRKYFALTDTFDTVSTIIFIHFSQNTLDEEYVKAQDEMDEKGPLFTEIFTDLEKAILNSKYLKDIENTFGELYIAQLKNAQDIFSNEIIEELQLENKYVSEYNKLKSGAMIEFQGKEYNLPQMQKFMVSSDREVRRLANKATWDFYENHDKEFGDIYDKLVKVRTKMAQKLGYENFVPLAYKRMQRLDYTAKEISKYRLELKKYLVPLAEKYRLKQMERIGIKDPHFYDYSINFIDGNPVPNGDTETLTNEAERMYHEMNEDIGQRFTYLKEHGHLDLEARKGKQGGGYEAPMADLKAPFIFSNFNKTQGDVEVLTHEFGHALQAMLGASYEVPSYRSPGMECCEMHSMSMEYLTYPYLHYLFDEENLRKYLYQHILDAIFFIPYVATVDEFQHVVYENPNLTPEERKHEWKKIEKEYTPHIHYGEDSEFLENGGFWYKQAHIFENPFYYIDYTIAQVVSLEFLVESHEDYKKALDKYLNYCKLGGTLPYNKLLDKASIANPMHEGVIRDLMVKVEEIIKKYEKNL